MNMGSWTGIGLAERIRNLFSGMMSREKIKKPQREVPQRTYSTEDLRKLAKQEELQRYFAVIANVTSPSGEDYTVEYVYGMFGWSAQIRAPPNAQDYKTVESIIKDVMSGERKVIGDTVIVVSSRNLLLSDVAGYIDAYSSHGLQNVKIVDITPAKYIPKGIHPKVEKALAGLKL